MIKFGSLFAANNSYVSFIVEDHTFSRWFFWIALFVNKPMHDALRFEVSLSVEWKRCKGHMCSI